MRNEKSKNRSLYRRNSATCKKSPHKNAAAFAAKTELSFKCSTRAIADYKKSWN